MITKLTPDELHAAARSLINEGGWHRLSNSSESRAVEWALAHFITPLVRDVAKRETLAAYLEAVEQHMDLEGEAPAFRDDPAFREWEDALEDAMGWVRWYGMGIVEGRSVK